MERSVSAGSFLAFMSIDLVELVRCSVGNGREHQDGLDGGLEGIVTIDNLLPLVSKLPCSWKHWL